MQRVKYTLRRETVLWLENILDTRALLRFTVHLFQDTETNEIKIFSIRQDYAKKIWGADAENAAAAAAGGCIDLHVEWTKS